MSQSDYYEILQVDPSATADEIRSAYRQRIAVAHPDKPNGDPELARALDEARSVLLDPIARARYDAERAGTELFDEAMDALSEVGNRAIDRLAVTVQARGRDLLGVVRLRAKGAFRKRTRQS